MEVPPVLPVMILPQATLFPDAMMPLYIFEPRYRRMLADALDTHRMFSIAQQRPGLTGEIPEKVAGLGLIRASVLRPDGTSNLVLEGITRLVLGNHVPGKPYRLQRAKPLPEPSEDCGVVAVALMDKARELAGQLVRAGALATTPAGPPSPTKFLRHLHEIAEPGPLADFLAATLLNNPRQQQQVLETLSLVDRLRALVHFLIAQLPDDPQD